MCITTSDQENLPWSLVFCAKNTIRFINPLTSSLLLKLNFKDLLTTLVSDLDQDLLSVTNDEGIDDALGIAERRIGTEERLSEL